jgi:hypothetical protein
MPAQISEMGCHDANKGPPFIIEQHGKKDHRLRQREIVLRTAGSSPAQTDFRFNMDIEEVNGCKI